MAAYAALASLMNTMEQIQIHPRFSTSFNKKQIEPLGDTANFLLDFIECYNGGGGSTEVEDLEGKIASAAHAAEDVIESHVVNQILAESTENDMEGGIESAAHATVEVAIESHLLDRILAGPTKQDLEGGIESPAHEAEEVVIETHMLDRILAGSTEKQKIMKKLRMLFQPRVVRDIMQKPMKLHLPEKPMALRLPEKPMKLHLPIICNLKKVTEDMDSIKENVRKIGKQGRFKDRQLITCSAVPPAASSRSVTAGKTAMVGFDDYLIQLMDKLTRHQSHLQVIPITGMGGIGKTTLSRNAFENLLIVQFFDLRAWASISQNYTLREILLQLLSSHEDIKKFLVMDEHQLGEQLHKWLFSRRYLIVLDDVWSIEVWDKIKFFLPDNNNDSGIVVTTRLLNVALHLNSSIHTVKLLDEDNSWTLFCQESFEEVEGCPAELEEVGKMICENCRGLPLAIVVIGGFLRKSSKSREYWGGYCKRYIFNFEL